MVSKADKEEATLRTLLQVSDPKGMMGQMALQRCRGLRKLNVKKSYESFLDAAPKVRAHLEKGLRKKKVSKE